MCLKKLSKWSQEFEREQGGTCQDLGGAKRNENSCNYILIKNCTMRVLRMADSKEINCMST